MRYFSLMVRTLHSKLNGSINSYSSGAGSVSGKLEEPAYEQPKKWLCSITLDMKKLIVYNPFSVTP